MFDNSWVLDRETTIYSKVKAMLLAKFKKKYPDLNVTEDGTVVTTAKFPNVYIKFLQPIEQGRDLEGITINAILLTVQVDVTTTHAQGMKVANEIAWEVLNIFKDMRFEVNMPEFSATSTETYRAVSRYSRLIGYDDII